ncbi:MAG: hypothetical protein ABFD91_09565 [Anaerohalosphaeraceae bacterium]
MTQTYSTRQVAAILQIKPQRLQTAVWDGTVMSPEKSPAGNFMWSIAEIESAAWALKRFPQFKAWQRRIGGTK